MLQYAKITALHYQVSSIKYQSLGDVGLEALWNRPQCHSGTPIIPDDDADKLSTIFGKKGYHFAHFNIRSLIPKLDEVRSFVQRTKAAVVALSETWLDGTVQDAEIEVNGYSIVRADRNRQGRGVLLYIRDGIAFNPRPDLSVEGLEYVGVDLLLPKSKPLFVGCIYRPPSDNTFLDKLTTSLDKLDLSSEIYLLGDLNIDLKSKSGTLYGKYVQFLEHFDFKQLINEATRVGKNSSTLLDHVITNCKNKVSNYGVLNCSLSDHLPVFMSRGCNKTDFSKPIFKRVRSMKNYSQELLLEELKKVNWTSVYIATHVDESLRQFVTLFHGVIDLIAPHRDIKVKQKTEPWFNSHIMSGIRRRDSLFRKWRKDRSNDSIHKEYCSVRNRVQRDIKKAKEFYFRDQIVRNQGNSSKLWSHLKSLGYGKTLWLALWLALWLW